MRRSIKHQLEDVTRQKDALETQCEAAAREKQRDNERMCCLSRSIEQAEADNLELIKDKTALSDRVTKLEGDLSKGVKALQQQEVEIDALVKTKSQLLECISEMKERLMMSDSHKTRLNGEIEELEKRLEGNCLKHKLCNNYVN